MTKEKCTCLESILPKGYIDADVLGFLCLFKEI